MVFRYSLEGTLEGFLDGISTVTTCTALRIDSLLTLFVDSKIGFASQGTEVLNGGCEVDYISQRVAENIVARLFLDINGLIQERL